jgi:hypothetical protein
MRTHFLPIVLSLVKERFELSELLLFLLLFSHASIVAAQGSGTFIPTGSMTTPRIGHTATLLLNGKVLIAGGTSQTRPISVGLAMAVQGKREVRRSANQTLLIRPRRLLDNH